ncbi:GTP-binding protein, partial [Candidatus Bathyarchaeota archaeon]
MPTNLPAEAQLAWQKYLEAKTLSEKIKALEQFISLVPKHKGTEKLLMQVKKTLTKLKLEASRKKELRKGSGIHPAFSIPKEEDAQIVLFGLPGTGKTALFNYLTENNIPYGKPTLLPNVGVLKYNGAVFQIIDLPPIFSDNIDSTPNGRSILSLVRNCDLVLLVTDLSQDIEWQLSTLMRVLKTARIIIDRDP